MGNRFKLILDFFGEARYGQVRLKI